jgi:hypothetical protein
LFPHAPRFLLKEDISTKYGIGVEPDPPFVEILEVRDRPA